MSRAVAIPMPDVHDGARRRAFMALPLALLAVWMIAGIATERAGAADCSGTPLTVAQISLPELPARA